MEESVGDVGGGSFNNALLQMVHCKDRGSMRGAITIRFPTLTVRLLMQQVGKPGPRRRKSKLKKQRRGQHSEERR